MKIKVSDYIAEFIIDKGITDVFGYPGGSVTNLVDSIHRRKEITAHVVYHEQAAAFAAAAYAQISGKVGIAYATGGPGATNLITGIGHAYYDSLPLFCLTGNVNTYESKAAMHVRQRAFQESDIISAVKGLTKYCAYVDAAEKISYYLERAYYEAMTGRKGPVLLDLPMNILREIVDTANLVHYEPAQDTIEDAQNKVNVRNAFKQEVINRLQTAKRPCFVLGNAIKTEHCNELICEIIDKANIPYVTSMIAFDVAGNHRLNYGFLGAYGTRAANFIAAKSDLIISIGSRLDIRQVGVNRENFAKNAHIIRVDIDAAELEYTVHKNESGFCLDINDAISALREVNFNLNNAEWLRTCNILRDKLSDIDRYLPNILIEKISDIAPKNAVISTDVGQNQVWVAQSFSLKSNQHFLFSGGMGAMGYALPAAIGAYYGDRQKECAICICGDGGFQMNIQELQFVAREQLPVKIFVMNNHALGMIRHFQEMYFEGKYYDTKAEGGYTVPNFTAIAQAYGIESCRIERVEDFEKYTCLMGTDKPALFEILINEDTYVFPKLEFGKDNQDQQPLIDRKLYEELNSL